MSTKVTITVNDPSDEATWQNVLDCIRYFATPNVYLTPREGRKRYHYKIGNEPVHLPENDVYEGRWAPAGLEVETIIELTPEITLPTGVGAVVHIGPLSDNRILTRAASGRWFSTFGTSYQSENVVNAMNAPGSGVLFEGVRPSS